MYNNLQFPTAVILIRSGLFFYLAYRLDSLFRITRTKMSIRYAKENDREKREKEREREKKLEGEI